jgi:hypothetical protein
MPRLPRALGIIAAVLLVLSGGAHFLRTFFVPGALLSIAAALMRRPSTLVTT